jgi:hypothetical protein
MSARKSVGRISGLSLRDVVEGVGLHLTKPDDLVGWRKLGEVVGRMEKRVQIIQSTDPPSARIHLWGTEVISVPNTDVYHRVIFQHREKDSCATDDPAEFEGWGKGKGFVACVSRTSLVIFRDGVSSQVSLATSTYFLERELLSPKISFILRSLDVERFQHQDSSRVLGERARVILERLLAELNKPRTRQSP